LGRSGAAALLGWDDLRELVRRGFSVQSHTMHHDFLAAQTPERQRLELALSKVRLEAELGICVDYVAYPFGFPGCHDAVTRRLVRETGYTAAFAQENCYLDTSSDPMALPRFGISRETPLWLLELILSGWHA
jgi:peptidoglycan/xylan/chitin deacetylase (PgdA/CDA1 family)